jgi:hypothetical protein
MIKEFLTLTGFILFTTISQVFGQQVEINTTPDKAHILTEGTAVHKTSPAKVKFIDSGRIYVFKENHIPVAISNDSPPQINLDLMPVIDLLNGKQTPKLEFSKLVISIPSTTQISAIGASNRILTYDGYVQRSLNTNLETWKEKITAELKNRGLNIQNDGADLFGELAEKENATYLLAAEITDVWISTIAARSYAVMEVKWSLFDPTKRKVVYSNVSYGYGTGAEGGRDHLDGCATTAARHITCDEDFINALLGSSLEQNKE